MSPLWQKMPVGLSCLKRESRGMLSMIHMMIEIRMWVTMHPRQLGGGKILGVFDNKVLCLTGVPFHASFSPIGATT